MLATPRRRVAAVAMVVLLVAVAAYFALRQPPAAAAQGKATLTVFVGTVQVERNGTTSFVAAHSGDTVTGGDKVQTGDSAKALLTYPDGATTRLDGATALTVRSLTAGSGGGWSTDLAQESGRTWNVVGRLLGGSFKLHAPNNSTAEVRGTEFSVVIGTDANGNKIVVFATWAGTILVSGPGGSVTVGAGQQSIVGKDGKPTPPSPIPDSSKFESWTVFNQTYNVTAGVPVGFQSGKLTAVAKTAILPGAEGDGNSDIQFTLGWPGSTMALLTFDPQGRVFKRVEGSTPGISIVAAQARKGLWSYQVEDLESKPNEIWWVIVSVVTPSKQTAAAFFLEGQTCAHRVIAGDVDSWSVTGQDSVAWPSVTASFATPPPAYATFVDSGNGVAAFTFSPPLTTAPTTLAVTVVATQGGSTARLECVETILPAPRLSSISGTVFGGDAGITLTLDPLGLQTVTGSGGVYSFGTLGPGAYTVNLRVPTGFVATSPTSLPVTLSGRDSQVADFRISPVPAIFGIAPSSGPATGGTAVVILGSGFAGATGVSFGGVAATFSVDSSSRLLATSPPHGAGVVDVVVSGPGGVSAPTRFLYLPVLTTINPGSGSAAGAATVVLGGAGFTGATQVLFGGAVAQFKVDSDGQITATSPAHATGAVDVVVTVPAGSASIGFVYLPAVTSLSLGAGPTTGGIALVVTGAGFTGAVQVRFGTTVAAQFNVDSDTQLTVTTPQHVSGPFHVVVRVPAGDSPATAADLYTFQNWVLQQPDVPAVPSIGPTPQPNLRGGAAMAYDPLRKRVVLFGGHSGNTYFNDTWLWDGAAWVIASPPPSPPPTGSPNYGTPGGRAYAAMTFDLALNEIVMIGGSSLYGPVYDVGWAWDGTGWFLLSDSNCSGGVQGPAAMPMVQASRSGAQPAVSPSRTTVEPRLTNPNCLGPRSGGTLAYDTASQKLVFWSGSPNDETYTSQDGIVWRLQAPAQAAPFVASGAVTTGTDGKPVLVGSAGGRLSTFTVPKPDCLPNPTNGHADIVNMTAGPGGTMWFTEGDCDVIGMITGDGVATRYQLPAPTGAPPTLPSPSPSAFPYTQHEPQYMVLARDGKFYFNEGDDDSVGSINPSAADPVASYRSWRLPTSNYFYDANGRSTAKEPVFIMTTTRTDASVDVWVAETEVSTFGTQSVFRIARLHVADGTWTEFWYDAGSDDAPTGLTTGSDGNIWFTTDAGRLGKIIATATDPAATQFFQAGTAGVHGRIINGPDGNLWWAGGEAYGWVKTTISATPAPSDYASWTVPSGLDPERIAIGPDRNIWITAGDSGDGNRIARITTSGALVEFGLPGTSLETSGIAAGADGKLWISLSDTNQIVALEPVVPVPGTFVWDSAANLWRLQSNATNPPVRDRTGLAPDPFSGRVVMFGGLIADGSTLGDTWTWNGSDWTLEKPFLSPSSRTEPALATDPSGGVFLFGGTDSPPVNTGTAHNDSYKWI